MRRESRATTNTRRTKWLNDVWGGLVQEECTKFKKYNFKIISSDWSPYRKRESQIARDEHVTVYRAVNRFVNIVTLGVPTVFKKRIKNIDKKWIPEGYEQKLSGRNAIRVRWTFSLTFRHDLARTKIPNAHTTCPARNESYTRACDVFYSLSDVSSNPDYVRTRLKTYQLQRQT